MHLILTRPALPGGTPAESTPRSPKPRAGCLAGFMGTGIFEQCHFLMGFEDTLTNLYEHSDGCTSL